MLAAMPRWFVLLFPLFPLVWGNRKGCDPAGASMLGRKELQKIKVSLGRITDEVHAILGVLDDFDPDFDPETRQASSVEGHLFGALQSISGLQSALSSEAISSVRSLSERWVVTPGEVVEVENISTAKAMPVKPSFLERWAARWAWLGPYVKRGFEKSWQIGEKMAWAGLFVLDISVVIGMMLFLESIGRKPKKLRQKRAETPQSAGSAPGTPIPAPTATAGRESSQWLAWLSQEELLAACLKEHWFKFVLGLMLAFAVRLPKRILRQESLILHLVINVSVTLRCVGLALVLVRDSLLSTKAEDVARETVNVLAERGVSSK